MNIKIRRHRPEDEILSNIFCLIVIGLWLVTMADGMSEVTGISYDVFSSGSKIVIALGLLRCIPILFRKANKKLIICFFVCLFIPLFQELVFYKNHEFFSSYLMSFATMIFPPMLCFCVINRYEILLNKFIKCSGLLSVLLLIVMIVWGRFFFSQGYSMGFANSMILPANCLMVEALSVDKQKRYRVISLCLAISDMLAVSIYGSRGALIAIIAFIIVWIIRRPESNLSTNTLVKKILICLSLVVLGLTYEKILSLVFQSLLNRGWQSRTMYLLVNDITHSSGRLDTWGIIWKEIQEHPFAVRGIASDRLLLGIYSHSFILELLHEFGVLIGGVFIIYILLSIIKTIIIKIDAFGTTKLLFLFCFFPLIIWSGTIWNQLYFWLWIVMGFRFVKKDHKMEDMHIENSRKGMSNEGGLVRNVEE